MGRPSSLIPEYGTPWPRTCCSVSSIVSPANRGRRRRSWSLRSRSQFGSASSNLRILQASPVQYPVQCRQAFHTLTAKLRAVSGRGLISSDMQSVSSRKPGHRSMSRPVSLSCSKSSFTPVRIDVCGSLTETHKLLQHIFRNPQTMTLSR